MTVACVISEVSSVGGCMSEVVWCNNKSHGLQASGVVCLLLMTLSNTYLHTDETERQVGEGRHMFPVHFWQVV